MDIDPVETTIEDSDETTTHIKTDTIKLQKRLNKKINTKDNPTENETTNPTKNNETQATKSRLDQLQDQRKKKKNQKPTPNPPIKTNLKLKWTSTIKKQEQLKQKSQAPIDQAGRVHTNTEVISERPAGKFKLPPAKFNTVPSPSKTKS